jgi:hypothetical protein
MWRFYGDWHFHCNHEVYCTKCGKIFPSEPFNCPEYFTHPKPTISAEQAAEAARSASSRR